VEDSMYYKCALKAAIDGHKVQHESHAAGCYMYFDENQRLFMNFTKGGTEEFFLGDGNCIAEGDWRIYTEPKVQPKFTIGSTVVYRSNRLATVVSISNDTPYEYTLANPNNPNSVFKKLESELKEAK